MPIPDDLKEHYPDDWDAIREAVLERAVETVSYLEEFAVPKSALPVCEWCRKPNGYRFGDSNPGDFKVYFQALVGTPRTETWISAHVDSDVVEYEWPDRPHDASKCVLTIAHLCQDPRCDNLDHLRALCQRCHLTYDAQSTQRVRRKRIQAKLRGQQTLSEPAGCDLLTEGLPNL
jgi:hypothetical protein